MYSFDYLILQVITVANPKLLVPKRVVKHREKHPLILKSMNITSNLHVRTEPIFLKSMIQEQMKQLLCKQRNNFSNANVSTSEFLFLMIRKWCNDTRGRIISLIINYNKIRMNAHRIIKKETDILHMSCAISGYYPYN